MREITIFYDNSSYAYKWLKPIMCAKKELFKLGYSVKYSSLLDYLPLQKLFNRKNLEKRNIRRACKGQRDIVLLAFHHSTSWLGTCPSEVRTKTVEKIKKHCKMLVWLDTADSTGTCLFDVMPFVDLYFKKQLLKDINYYTKEIWGSRVYCEFYHNKLGIEDPQVSDRKYPILESQYASKLRLSWNVGIGDLFAFTWDLYLHPFSMHKPRFISPDSANKTLDLQYRGSSFSPIAGYQRQYCKDFVSRINYISHSDPYQRVPHDEYVREGEIAKAIISPFGWGEVCGRDFEAMVYGATMIKMSMEHSVTFPDAYQPYITYVPVKWDFSDLDEILRKVPSEEYRQIARSAQKFYLHCFTDDFRKEFAEHIVSELERNA